MKPSSVIKVVLSASLLVVVTALWWKTRASSEDILKERISRTKVAVQEFASQVEVLRSKTGVLPTNEAQLAELLGKPLPRSAWDGQLKYSATNGWFRVETVSPFPQWMIFEYDSRNPTAGVAVYPF